MTKELQLLRDVFADVPEADPALVERAVRAACADAAPVPAFHGGRRRPVRLALNLGAVAVATCAVVVAATVLTGGGVSQPRIGHGHRVVVRPVVPSTVAHPVVATNGGIWSLQPAPSLLMPATGSGPSTVSCLSTQFCMVVGYLDASAHLASALWDGRSWRVAPMPGVPAQPSTEIPADCGPHCGGFNNPGAVDFNSVSCPTTSMCAAVGNGLPTAASPVESYIEMWDGSGWRLAFRQTADYPKIQGVSCPAASFCLAVGANRYGGYGEVWNGTTWTSTSIGDAEGPLSVSCPGPQTCVILGQLPTKDLDVPTFAMLEWIGGRVRTLATLVDVDRAQGLTCLSVDWCQAVFGNTDELWNGRVWRPQRLPAPGVSLSASSPGSSEGSVPAANVSGSSPRSRRGNTVTWDDTSCWWGPRCVAVGSVGRTAGPDLIVVDALHGRRWSTVKTFTPAPDPIPGAWSQYLLNRVSCAPGGYCMAVGVQTPKPRGPTSVYRCPGSCVPLPNTLLAATNWR